MNKFALLLAGVVFTGTAFAAPPTYLEFAYITGGENNNRGGNAEKDGFEFAGSWGFNDNWYAGGIIGTYENGNSDFDYININGGYSQSLNDKLSMILEGGLWFGDRDAPNANGGNGDPTAIEAKVGLNTMLSDKLGLFGTFSLVGGDLDNVGGNDDLSNFIWSLGGSYAFTENLSLSVKLVDGVNGVNGQDEVLRIGGRYTF
jgi:hypothetical protein